MKKKTILICFVVLVFIVLGGWMSLKSKLFSRISKSYVGEMSLSVDEKTTSSNSITFKASKNDKLKFSFKSNINSGDLEVVLYNSNKEQVYSLDQAKELETFYEIEDTDTYTLRVEYTGFTGRFKIEVYSAKH